MGIETLMQLGVVDIEKLIIENKVNLNLDLEQLGFLLVFYRYTTKTNFLLPSIQQLSKETNIEVVDIKRLQNILFQTRMCEIDTKTEGTTMVEYVNWSYLYQRLVENKPQVPQKNEHKSTQVEIVKLIEREFGRMLSPFEIESVSVWCRQYESADIIEAIKEAVISGVQNLRYIDRILINWAQGGKRKNTFKVEEAQSEEVGLEPYFNWLEEKK